MSASLESLQRKLASAQVLAARPGSPGEKAAAIEAVARLERRILELERRVAVETLLADSWYPWARDAMSEVGEELDELMATLSDQEVAERLRGAGFHVHHVTVWRWRRALKIPSATKQGRPPSAREKCLAYLRDHPRASVDEVVAATGASPRTVSRARSELRAPRRRGRRRRASA